MTGAAVDEALVARLRAAVASELTARTTGSMLSVGRRLDRDDQAGLARELINQRDLDDLDASLRDSLPLDDAGLIPAVAAAVLVAAVLRYVAATLAHVAAVAAESGIETTRLILQAADAAYEASPEVRGLVILLGVVASVSTLRSKS